MKRSRLRMAAAARVRSHIDESPIPVNEDVRGACEILGLERVYVAREGSFTAFVPPCELKEALLILGDQAQRIGVVSEHDGVLLRSMRD